MVDEMVAFSVLIAAAAACHFHCLLNARQRERQVQAPLLTRFQSPTPETRVVLKPALVSGESVSAGRQVQELINAGIASDVVFRVELSSRFVISTAPAPMGLRPTDLGSYPEILPNVDWAKAEAQANRLTAANRVHTRFFIYLSDLLYKQICKARCNTGRGPSATKRLRVGVCGLVTFLSRRSAFTVTVYFSYEYGLQSKRFQPVCNRPDPAGGGSTRTVDVPGDRCYNPCMLVGEEKPSAQVERILQSDTFRSSGVLRRLFRFLADKAFCGEADQLKEYSIGIDAFGKPPTYDPRQDAIVRLQVGRLRQKLGEYYRTEGKDDPVVMELPKGRFKLSWQARSAPVAPLDPVSTADPGVTPAALAALRDRSGRSIAAFRSLGRIFGGTAVARSPEPSAIQRLDTGTGRTLAPASGDKTTRDPGHRGPVIHRDAGHRCLFSQSIAEPLARR